MNSDPGCDGFDLNPENRLDDGTGSPSSAGLLDEGFCRTPECFHSDSVLLSIDLNEFQTLSCSKLLAKSFENGI